MPYSIAKVKGVSSTRRRAVVFLACNPGDDFVNAHSVQDDDSQNGKLKLDHLRVAVGYYLGEHHNNKRHHGWDKSQHGGRYVQCYVFKDLAQALRFYGFVVHPPSLPRLKVIVIVHMATKTEFETETALLDRILQTQNQAAVQDAVLRYTF